MNYKSRKTTHRRTQTSVRISQTTVSGLSRVTYDFLGILIITAIGFTIYSNTFNASFHFDDIVRLVENPALRILSDIKAWWGIYQSRPMGMLTFALNYRFSGYEVRYYHLINIIIHIINACLAGWLTILIFDSPAIKDIKLAQYKRLLAFTTSLLFLTHPLATQSVTYIIQRFNSLAALFCFLSLILYMQGRIQSNSIGRKRLLFTAAAVSGILGMLSKENAFCLPMAIIAMEIFFLRPELLISRMKDIRLMATVTGSIILVLGFTAIFTHVFHSVEPVYWGNNTLITPWNYLLTQFSVIPKYIQLLILPFHQNVDYDFPIASGLFNIKTIAGLLMISGLILLSILSFKKFRILSFGIVWFFLTISIESGIIPIMDVIFEHRTYFPSYGFFLIISTGIITLYQNKYKTVALILIAVLTLSWSWLTFDRNKVWINDISLWTDASAKSPAKFRPVFNLGIAYYKAGQYDSAAREFSHLTKLKPDLEEAWLNLGDADISLEKWGKAAEDYARVTEINPKSANAWYNLGIAYGHDGQIEKAQYAYAKAIQNDQKHIKAYLNIGVLYANAGQWYQAIAYYTRAAEIQPQYRDAWFNLGVACYNLKQYDKAILQYSKAIETDPVYAPAWSNRGVAYGASGQWEKAISDYTHAISIDPGYRDAVFNRGVAYYNTGQWDNALQDYRRTLEIDPEYGIANYYISLTEKKMK